MSIDWKLLWKSRWLILIAFILAAAISAISFALLPRQWAAMALIQVGSVTMSGGQHSQVPIESAAVLADNLRLPGFVESVATAAGLPKEAVNLLPRVYGGHGWLEVTQVGKHAVLLRLRADGRERAKKLAQTIVNTVIARDGKVLALRIAALSDELNALERDLVAVRARSPYASIGSELVVGARSTSPYVSGAGTGQLGAIRTIVDLHSKIARIKSLLAFPYTVKTRSNDGVSLIARPVFPRPSVFVGFWIVLWLIMSMVFIRWRMACGKRSR